MRIEIVTPGGDLSDAFKVRMSVFIDEQGFTAEIEIDETDPVAHHVIFYEGDKPIATARTFPDKNKPGYYIIGRVAVLKDHRGGKMGLRLMQAIEKLARSLGAKGFTLGAQLRVSPFYAKCGYTATDKHYYEEYCEHVYMHKSSDMEIVL